MPPRRAAAPAPSSASSAASRPARATRRTRAAVSTSDEEEDAAPVPAPRSARLSARSSTTTSTRSSIRSSTRRTATPSDDETVVDDAGQDVSQDQDEEEELDEDELADQPRSARASLTASFPRRSSRSPRSSEASAADESVSSMATAASHASSRASSRASRMATPAGTPSAAGTPRASLAPVSAPVQVSAPAAPALPPAGPKTRFVIHKMVLVDFKSYAGRQTIGPFHKSFSAVVGPNGSGKSNVIDALLFVFGWRANKMRQGKLSELIHHSAAHEDLPQCSVEIWFREIEDLPGPDAYRVVPKSRLVVARTAFRNNTSVYTVNGRKSTFGEVGTLLRSHGIDLDHKRFLILQGEVESIAQMPPKGKTEHEEGLLEYLEDIIGTSEFKEPIEEAAAKVDLANEQRSLKLDRLKYVQKEKQALEHKKEEAEAYLRDQNELTQRQSALWQIYMLECQQQMEIASEAIAKLGTKLEAERERCADSVGASEKLTAELEEATRLFEAAKKEADRVGKELATCERRSLQVDESRKHLESKSRKLTKQLAEQRKALSDAQQTSDDSSAASEKLKRELATLEASLVQEEAELDRIRDSLKDKTQVFAAQIEAKQRELQPWSDKIMHKENEHKLALEEKALLTSRVEQAQEQLTVAEQAVDEIDAVTEAKQEELISLERERDEIDDRIAQGEKQLASMRKAEDKLRAAADVTRGRADEARSSSSSNQTRSAVLNSLNRQAELGLIKGYHGRLGSLGSIDPEYDVAISTACPGLESIVVDHVDAGQACIEHLRQHNLGRANFILLANVSKGSIPSVRTPENAPRLFDLVRPANPIYAPAFYHQLRDTLVAKDLAHANRIAYGAQRWRVVTLDGQLIEKSGAMSGGGTRVARGAMSATPVSNVSPEQLARLEKEAQLASEELRSHRASVAHVRDSLERMQNRKPEIGVDLDKVQMALSVAEQRRKAAVERLEAIKRETLPNEEEAARIAELDKHMAKIERDLDKLRAGSSGINEAITELEDQIMKVGGIELRAQKAKVDGIKEMIELNNERTVKADVARGRAEMDSERAHKTIADIEAQLESLQTELQQVAEAVAERRAEMAEVEARAQAAREEMEEHEAAREQLADQLEEFSDAMNRFRRLEVETKQKVEDNERSLADNKKRLAHWTDRIGKLQLHLLLDDQDDEEEGENKLQLPMYPVEEVQDFDKETLKAEIVIYEERLAKGSANLTIIEEYRKREQDFLEHARALEATTAERDAAKQQYETLRKERFDKFMASFSVISAKLKEMYQTITLGGNAELELVDSLDPFSEGIIFSVMPPKKSWRNISNLSGGEKTLSSLALVFALHSYKPTPLYVMDEIDAALDFRNVSIVANLIKERTKGAQFVIISLRNNMFELAARLVGIYKTSGMTKSLTIENKDLRLAGEEEERKPLVKQERRLPLPRPSVLTARPSAASARLSRGAALVRPS